MPATLKKGDAVFLEWEDSYGCSTDWADLDGNDQPLQTMLCRSIGWIVRTSKRSIVLVPHIAANEKMGVKQGCGDMTIPRAAIVHSRKLNLPKP